MTLEAFSVRPKSNDGFSPKIKAPGAIIPGVIAEGNHSRIIRDDSEPYCVFKVPKLWLSPEIRRMKALHSKLQHLGVTTLDIFEPDYYKRRVKMTDLTEGGRNLVVSYPDVMRQSRLEEETKVWHSSARNRPLYNPSEFFEMLENDVCIMQSAGIDVCVASPHLVASPTGKIATFFADFEDGYADSKRKIQYTGNALFLYLKGVVVNFFPDLDNESEKFLVGISETHGIKVPLL